MKLIKPDFNGTVEIEGITGPVPRPVSIDQAITGFERLRTLRVYQFSAGVPVDGHAEEDEVFLVILSGSVELNLSGQGTSIGPIRLDAADRKAEAPCAAYLPPHGEYRLVPITSASVAYVRARPQSGPPPKVFPMASVPRDAAKNVVFDAEDYAQRLRLRIVAIPTVNDESSFAGVADYNADRERLIHIQDPGKHTSMTACDGDELVSVSAWDTVILRPGEHPVLKLSRGASPLIFVFAA
jgi:hypothetical protein